MAWLISDFISGQSKLEYNDIADRLTSVYARDQASSQLAGGAVLTALCFNLLLLGRSKITLNLFDRSWTLLRSVGVLGSHVAFDGVPAVCHILSDGSTSIALICGGLYNRPLTFFDPRIGSLFHADPSVSETMIDEVVTKLKEFTIWACKENMTEPPRILLYCSPPNYIHELTNILSGFILATMLSEQVVLVSSGAFYGSPARFASPKCIVSNAAFAHYHLGPYTRANRVVLSRPVSFYVPPQLLSRLRGEASGAERERPTIAIAVRGRDRICINEAELVSKIIQKISEKGRYRFLIIGWIGQTDSSKEYRKTFKLSEVDFGIRVNAIVEPLKAEYYIRGINGWEMPDVIQLLKSCQFYVSPCGTLNHLISWMSGAVGIVFGPSAAVALARNWNERSIGSAPIIELPERFVTAATDGNSRSNFSVNLDAAQFIADTSQEFLRQPNI